MKERVFQEWNIYGISKAFYCWGKEDISIIFPSEHSQKYPEKNLKMNLNSSRSRRVRLDLLLRVSPIRPGVDGPILVPEDARVGWWLPYQQPIRFRAVAPPLVLRARFVHHRRVAIQVAG